ncbi:metalloendopeptidase-like membrane protein [Polaromonas sp. CF318]|uniref:M23 family metallopeptidase n=1 Tax=Polaromonas sp. CF318 TaxID=1144318 RepID=UPI000270DBB6|nr:M23 family metallopeptidase [Polaromonas sp. CF318]EJL78898.1 metalloendopeptidase-like membrane protein [Polaromonas sp. CF318]
MRRFFMLLLAPFMFAGSFQAMAAGPKAGLDKFEFAGAHDQNTPVLLSAASRPVPFLGADGRVHIDYELQVINARAVPVKLVSLEVLDAGSGKVLASVSGAEVARTFSLLGGAATDSMDAAQAGFFWIDVVLEPGQPLPKALSHRVVTAGAEVRLTAAVKPASEGTVQTTQTGGNVAISTRPAPLIGPPLEGTGWVAFNGCCKEVPHRRAGIPVNGVLYVSQRFAIDWIKLDANSQQSNGDSNKNANWPTYGQKAIAVADAKVVSVLDGLPERVPNALPPDTTMQNVTGNHVVLDLGRGYYAFYAHLQPGSLKVRIGDRVKRGQVLALLGNSGNTTAPHLHFHVSDGMGPLSSQGLPYVIDAFVVKGLATDATEQGKVVVQPLPQQGPQRAALPMDAYVVDFPALK